MFVNSQARVYQELDGNTNGHLVPEANESLEFWGGIWGVAAEHNKEAEWLDHVRESLGGNTHTMVTISPEKIRLKLRKVSNWKAPGMEGVQGFWLKKLTILHGRMSVQLQELIETGAIPQWMNLGRTVLCVKDRTRGNAVDNFRPITCLPLMWKLFTGIISDNLYEYLDSSGILPVEQKGCRRDSRGTKDQLLIDKLIIKNCKRRKTNLSMAWIDYKKAYDMIPHSWILECLKMVGVDEKVITMLENSMGQWKVMLTADGNNLGNINIRRGIFQGDSLSPLLFVISLIPLSLILRKCNAQYSLGKDKPSINHLLFMDDLKLYARSDDAIDSLVRTVRLFSQDIGMQFSVKNAQLFQSEGGMLLNVKESIYRMDNR